MQRVEFQKNHTYGSVVPPGDSSDSNSALPKETTESVTSTVLLTSSRSSQF
jgi:hypothetical protein